MDLSGEWQGYYLNPDLGVMTPPDVGAETQFPIVARLVSRGRRFEGSMRDLRTVEHISYQAAIERSPEGLSREELEEARALLSKHPDLYLRTELPSDSKISGSVSFPSVRFVKTYMGYDREVWGGFGAEKVVRENANHRVWYEGKLSGDGRVLEGEWVIRAQFLGAFRPALQKGAFRLERV